MAINLFASFTRLRQAEPPEGRAMYSLGAGPGGGDGLTFATGNEVFQFNSNQIPGPQRPSGILGMWVDATNLTAGKNLIIKTANQIFVFAGGAQGYIPITSPVPFNVSVSTNGGLGTVAVILYNYNPLFTGSVTTAPAVGGSSGGSGSGSQGSGGGSGFGESGGSGGGRPTF